MPSTATRLFNAYCRAVIRRETWGDTPQALARRARRVFHVPPAMARLALRGARVVPVREDAAARDAGAVRGEWVLPPRRATASDGAPPDLSRGALLYLHGGGYVACTAADRRPIAAALARALDVPVLTAEYRLAPEARFPAAHDDAVAAYRWLRARTGPDAPIVVAGESAGGGLALLVAQAARDLGLVPPACIAALSPWTDLAGTGASLHANDGHDAMFRPPNIPAFAAAYLGDAPADDPRASPLYGDARGLPPVLLQVGADELLRDDARRMHARLRAAGGTSVLREWPHVAHAWQLAAPFVPEATAAVDEIAAFVRAHLARETTSAVAFDAAEWAHVDGEAHGAPR
jgi:acetyl esterase/lipase